MAAMSRPGNPTPGASTHVGTTCAASWSAVCALVWPMALPFEVVTAVYEQEEAEAVASVLEMATLSDLQDVVGLSGATAQRLFRDYHRREFFGLSWGRSSPEFCHCSWLTDWRVAGWRYQWAGEGTIYLSAFSQTIPCPCLQ